LINQGLRLHVLENGANRFANDAIQKSLVNSIKSTGKGTAFRRKPVPSQTHKAGEDNDSERYPVNSQQIDLLACGNKESEEQERYDEIFSRKDQDHYNCDQHSNQNDWAENTLACAASECVALIWVVGHCYRVTVCLS
jgi:hypothetical protein